MRLGLAVVFLLLCSMTACGEEGAENSARGGSDICKPLASGRNQVGDLQVEPEVIAAGAPVTVRLDSGDTVSAEALSVVGDPPLCRSFRLYQGELVEMNDGDGYGSLLSFKDEIAFDVPQDAEAGQYAVCTVTPRDNSTVDVCGSVTVR